MRPWKSSQQKKNNNPFLQPQTIYPPVRQPHHAGGRGGLTPTFISAKYFFCLLYERTIFYVFLCYTKNGNIMSTIDKVEGIFGDMVVFWLDGNWYGIPKWALVQVDVVVRRYGLVVSAVSLQDDGIAVKTCVVGGSEIIADRVVLLTRRWIEMGGNVLDDLRALIRGNTDAFSGLLVSYLIP